MENKRYFHFPPMRPFSSKSLSEESSGPRQPQRGKQVGKLRTSGKSGTPNRTQQTIRNIAARGNRVTEDKQHPQNAGEKCSLRPTAYTGYCETSAKSCGPRAPAAYYRLAEKWVANKINPTSSGPRHPQKTGRQVSPGN